MFKAFQNLLKCEKYLVLTIVYFLHSVSLLSAMIQLCILLFFLIHDKSILGIEEPIYRQIPYDYALSQIHMVPLLQIKEQAVKNLSNYSKALENRLKNVEL